MAYALAARLERAVKRAGVKYKKVSGWASRGHGSMGSIQSVIIHHTAGPKSGNTPSLNVVAYGRPGLSGPLSQLFLARDGTVYLVAAGLSYHAGRVKANMYTNSHAIGIEAENTGLSNDSPWPAHQVNEYAKLCKALCDEFNLSTSRVVGHKEAAPGRKIDPTFNCNQFRAKVGGAKGGVSSGGGSTGGSSKTYKTVGYGTTLGLYDKGEPVKEWQIEALGYKGAKADGYFGPGTEKDTKALQKEYGVKADGLVGPKTWPLRNKVSKGKYERPKTPDKPKPVSFPLPKGHWFGPESSNSKNHSGYYSKDRAGIKLIQKKLGLSADGLYGPKTYAAVSSFQRRSKIRVDGAVGSVTWSKLF